MGYSQPQNVKVINYSYYIDNQGFLDVVGLVQNVGTNTVGARANPVILTGLVYAPDGEQESSSYCQVWAYYLTPGQQAPFYMEFPPPQTTNIWLHSDVGKIILNVARANATNSYQYPDLKITSSVGSIGTIGGYNGAYVVNGEIKNTGTQSATNMSVVGAFFNSTGSVVAVGYTNYLVPTVLIPGNTTTFEIAAFDLNQTLVSASLQIHNYQLLVQTELPILQGTPTPPPGTTSTSPSTSSTSSPSSSSKTGGNSKNSSIGATIYVIVIAAVILAVAAAVAVLVLRRSKPHQTVKETRKAKKQKAR